jgi:hypothetical protein
MNNHYTQSLFTRKWQSLVALVFLTAISFSSYSQVNKSVTANVLDPEGKGAPGISVKLVSDVDSVMTSTDNNGYFTLSNVKGTTFKITLTSITYDTVYYNGQFEAGKTSLLLPPFTLKMRSNLLADVDLRLQAQIVVKEDTLEYDAKNLKLREGAVAEDALKRLDGVEVDKDGNVTARGEAVTRVRVNGKDYFGGDLKAATKNLPAEIIEKLQIIDDYGDMANITGIRTGDPERILNIQIDPRFNRGEFGNFKAGGGTEDRYQASATMSIKRNNLELGFMGNVNNVNAQMFDFNVQGGGARRGGGGGGGMGGGGMGGFGGGGSGLTNTNSFGVNYRQDVNENLTMYGDYSYGYTNNATLSNNINNYIAEQLEEIRRNESGARSYSHRFSYNVEYKPTDVDYFKLTPTLRIQDRRNTGLIGSDNSLNGVLENRTNTNSFSNNLAPNYGVSGLYNRRLSDNGRNLFFNFSANTSSTEQDEERIQETSFVNPQEDQEVYIRSLVDLQNKSFNGGASVAYTEPLSQFMNWEFSYDYNISNYNNRRFDNALDLAGQQIEDDEIFIGNRIFDYSFQTHRFGTNLRYRSDKIIYSIGASVQPSLLSGDASIQDQTFNVHRKALNFAPIARFEYKFSRTKNLTFNYSGRSNEPSFSQLQPFTDYSNRNSPVTGNPDLNPEFRHEVRLNFNNFDQVTGRQFMVGMSGNTVQDRIVSNRSVRLDPQLGVINETSYLNTDGYYQGNLYYNYAYPLFNKTFVPSYGGFSRYENGVSFNQDKKIESQNFMIAQTIRMRYIPTEKLELSPGITYSYNNTQNSNMGNRGTGNTEITQWQLTFNGSVNITPTFIFGGDLAKTTNNGYSAVVGSNPFIINAYLEKQFLKGRTGSIRFQAYDLLNEQVNVSRTITENMINDSRTNRLARYFMLTLSYRFNTMVGGNSSNNERGQFGPGGQGRMNMGGGMGRGGH